MKYERCKGGAGDLRARYQSKIFQSAIWTGTDVPMHSSGELTSKCQGIPREVPLFMRHVVVLDRIIKIDAPHDNNNHLCAYRVERPVESLTKQ